MRVDYSIGVTTPAKSRLNGPPTALFAAGTTGFLFDPSQISTLFQDAAGTIPVTATNQPVGRINDISGKGNHAVQASASARPLYITDGSKHWLEFDGVNDHLTIPVINWASLQATIGTGLRKNVDTRATVIDGEGAPRFTIEAPGPSGTDFAAFLWSSLSVNATVRHVAAAPVSGVLVADFDMSNRKVRMSVNGGTALSATAASGSGTFSAGVVSIGRRTGSAQYLNGRVYGLVGIGRLLTPAETTQITAFLNTKTGAF
jgi:hypothetical protein